MGRLVDSYRLNRHPPREVLVGGVRYSFEVVYERPWWTFQVTKHGNPSETVKLCSNPRGRSDLDADLFERGFSPDSDAKARRVAGWLVRQGYAVTAKVKV